MANKTIPELSLATSINENTLFVIDTGTQTFKIEAESLLSFFRDGVLAPGIVQDFAGASAPDGWLLCNGSEVSRVTYADLFDIIGITYGPGNGSTTFNLPDLRGRVVAGLDNMGGSAASRITNAVSGIVGTTLGAAGGDQIYTPAGTIGGSQSIAHVHSFSHTHGMQHSHLMSHVHVWADVTSNVLYSKNSAAASSTSISNADTIVLNNTTAGSGVAVAVSSLPSGSGDKYTAGAISTPVGAGGSDAYTGLSSEFTGGVSGSTSDTGGMSTASTVNGTNFSFTGTAGCRVQPTMMMNKIIKT